MSNESFALALDADWVRTMHSPEARRALKRWSACHPLLACRRDLADVVATRRAIS